MSVSVKFNSRQVERTQEDVVTTICWTGTQSEIQDFSQAEQPGAGSSDGKLKSIRVFQEGPNIWVCEKKYISDLNGDPFEKPNIAYGKKSAQLSCSMLSLPLESAKNYRKKWNHFLVAAPGISAIPDWWYTATAQTSELIGPDAQKYAWVKAIAEAPNDKNGRWQVLKNPTKPGRDNFEVATYSITETAKFRSPHSAGTMIANTANKLGRPIEDFGLTPPGYNWKCDNASVSYNGKAWYATLTWTRSGNNKGWDMEPYQE